MITGEVTIGVGRRWLFFARGSTAILGFLGWHGAVAGPQDAGFPELERVALEEMSRTRTPGVALAVIRDDRVVWARGLRGWGCRAWRAARR